MHLHFPGPDLEIRRQRAKSMGPEGPDVNALKNNVWSLSLHEFKELFAKICKMLFKSMRILGF